MNNRASDLSAALPEKQLTTFLRRHSLIIGIILIFLFTWPIDLSNSGVLPFQIPLAIYVFIGWGILIASLIMTGLTLGKKSVIELLRRFLIWRTGWKWYLIAFFLYPVILISAVVLNAAFTQTRIDFSVVLAHRIFGPTASLPFIILPYFLFEAIANGEEIGWRGYVLPRLQAKYSALISSLFVGVIWGLWHLPRFLAPGNTSPLGWFMLKIMAEAVVYTWLYNNTGGSLLLITIFHAAGNTAGMFLPVATTVSGINLNILIIQIAFVIMVAIVVTLIEGSAQLSRTEPKQVQE